MVITNLTDSINKHLMGRHDQKKHGRETEKGKDQRSGRGHWGKFVFGHGGKILLTRLGGINAVTQEHFWQKVDIDGNPIHHPPESRGFYASPYGHGDPFLYGHRHTAALPKKYRDPEFGKKTNQLPPEERQKEWDAQHEAYKQVAKRLKPTQFWLGGGFYSHFAPPYEKTERRWYYWESAREWAKEAKKHLYVTTPYGIFRTDPLDFEIFVPGSSIQQKHLLGRYDQKKHGHGDGPSMTTLPVQATPSEKRQFYETHKDRYQNDVKFHNMCDFLYFYTQGGYSPCRLMAKCAVSGDPEQTLRQYYSSPRFAKTPEQTEQLVQSHTENRMPSISVFGEVYSIADIGKSSKQIMVEEPETLDAMLMESSLTGAKEVLSAINAQPESTVSLYRGMIIQKSHFRAITEGKMEEFIATRPKEYYTHEIETVRKLAPILKVGSEFDEVLGSYSHDPNVAYNFSHGVGSATLHKLDPKNDIAITIEVVGPSKSLNVSTFSRWRQSEALVAGKFRVKSIELQGIELHVKVEQVASYDSKN